MLSFFELPTIGRADSWFFDLFFILSVLADFFPGHSQAAIQAIEADRKERRAYGAEITANAPGPLTSIF